jgi:hypothetical protein
MEYLDDLRADLRPGKKEKAVMGAFKKMSSDGSQSFNPAEFWVCRAKECQNVIDAVKLYLDASGNQFPGYQVIKNRILFLANQGKWGK